MTYIYESPDGGKTITRRRFQDSLKEVKMGDRWEEYQRNQARKNEWERILLLAEKDPGLKEMVDQVMVYVQLKHPAGRL